jgi:hypothetical protein
MGVPFDRAPPLLLSPVEGEKVNWLDRLSAVSVSLLVGFDRAD